MKTGKAKKMREDIESILVSEEEIAEMKRICAERRAEIEHLYKMSYDICR